MKKFLLAVTFVLLHFTLFAQSLSFSALGGLVIAQEHYSPAPFIKYSNPRPIATFSVGGITYLNYKHFSLQTGLFLTGQGGKINATYSPPVQMNITSKANVTSRLLYLRIPADFIYRMQTGSRLIYFGAGPYAAVGLSGKASGIEQDETNNNPGTIHSYFVDEKVTFGGNSGDRLMQFGANATAGIKFKNQISLNINFDWGLTNLYQTRAEQGAFSRTLGISTGYCFR